MTEIDSHWRDRRNPPPPPAFKKVFYLRNPATVTAQFKEIEEAVKELIGTTERVVVAIEVIAEKATN